MKPDPLAQFRELLPEGGNAVSPPQSPKGGSNTVGGVGGGGTNVPGGGFGGRGGMDPWQQSVENRIGRIEDRLGSVETQLATLNERVSHLPTKTWMGVAALGIVGALTAAIGYAEKIQAFLN